MTPSYARRLLQYNLWANRQILGALQQLPALAPETRPARLFSHLLTAEELWLARVRGEHYAGRSFWPELDPASWPQRLPALHEAWLAFLDAHGDDFDARFAYTNSKGQPYATTLRDILTHLVIHGQHHRAQIAALLRESGHTPPLTDYIYFTRDAASGDG